MRAETKGTEIERQKDRGRDESRDQSHKDRVSERQRQNVIESKPERTAGNKSHTDSVI